MSRVFILIRRFLPLIIDVLTDAIAALNRKKRIAEAIKKAVEEEKDESQ